MEVAEEKILDISWRTVVKVSAAVFALYALYLIRELLVWFAFAIVISILFNPAIDFLHRRKVPRVLAATFVYVAVLGALVLLLYSIALIFIGEIQEFSQSFPKYFDQLAPLLSGAGVQAFANTEAFLATVRMAVQQIGANIFNTLFVIFGGLFSTFFIISIAFFLSLEEKSVDRGLSFLFPRHYESTMLSLWARAQKRVTGWFFTRIVGSVFVGVLSYATFLIFNVNYPVTLALISALFNFVPMVGPIATGFLILIIVGLDSPITALAVLAAFTLIQQIESNILTPAITKKFVGISPALVLLALAVGGKLWGLLGAILVVPMVGMLAEFLHDFLQKQRSEEH